MSAARSKTSKVRCWWLHDWAPWEELGISKITRDGLNVGMAVFQKRKCFRCGRIQTRMSQTYI